MGRIWVVLLVIVTVALGAGLYAMFSAEGGRPQSVAVGPLEIGPTPREVMFFGPVPATGPRCELCFEFDRPDDSRAASQVRVVLVTPEGRQDTLWNPEVDRRGERRVCLIDRSIAVREEPGRRYRSAWLWSETTMRVDELRFWSGGK